MKTLEQLNISPTPWNSADDGMGFNDITCSSHVTEDSEGENFIAETVDTNDARLISAAPELYEALYDVVAYCESTHLVPSESSFGKVLSKVKAALAKAAGEETEE